MMARSPKMVKLCHTFNKLDNSSFTEISAGFTYFGGGFFFLGRWSGGIHVRVGTGGYSIFGLGLMCFFAFFRKRFALLHDTI